jgi:hypothetical protein
MKWPQTLQAAAAAVPLEAGRGQKILIMREFDIGHEVTKEATRQVIA